MSRMIEFTDEQIIQVEALAACLSLEQVADYFGITKMTFYALMDRNPEILLRYKKGKAVAIQEVAQGLIAQAKGGDKVCQMFFLKTQAGWREQDFNTETDKTASAASDFLKAISLLVTGSDGTTKTDNKCGTKTNKKQSKKPVNKGKKTIKK